MNGGPAAYESAALPTELHRHDALFAVVNRYELERGSFTHSQSMKGVTNPIGMILIPF